MSAWNMSRCTVTDWMWLSGTSPSEDSFSRKMSTFGAAASAMALLPVRLRHRHDVGFLELHRAGRPQRNACLREHGVLGRQRLDHAAEARDRVTPGDHAAVRPPHVLVLARALLDRRHLGQLL